MILTATINEVKRRVTFDNPNAVVAVKGDYEVNGVAFAFPAIYEDDFDLSTAVKTVYYKATDGIIYNHVVTDTDTDTGYPLWVFKDEINKGAYGDVEFALVCDKVEGGNIVKRWVSMITAFRVQKSIEIDESEQEDNEQTYSERLAYLMTQMANMQATVNGLASGAPTPESLVANMQEGHIYVYTGTETGYTAGHIYYYVNGALTDGGQYGSISVDTTLTVSGAAADAKVVGDELDEIKEDLSSFEDAVIVADASINLGNLMSGSTINAVTGGNVAATYGTRTNYVDFSAPILIEFNFDLSVYRYDIFTYAMHSVSSVSGNPTNGVFTTDKRIIVLVPDGTAPCLRIGIIRIDRQAMTTDISDPNSDFYKIKNGISFYRFTDATLSKGGVSADAFATGVAIKAVRDEIQSGDICPKHIDGETTQNGITVVAKNGVYKISGTATANNVYNLFYNESALPSGIEAGKSYKLKVNIPSLYTKIRVAYYNGTEWALLADGTYDTEFTVPVDAVGFYVRIFFYNNGLNSPQFEVCPRIYPHNSIGEVEGELTPSRYPMMMTIIDDDGYGSFYTDLLPLCIEKCAPIASAVITARVGVSTGFMTWEQVQECSRDGAEILSHGYNHKTDAEVLAEGTTVEQLEMWYRGARNDLELHGIRSDILVFNNNTANVIQCQQAARRVYKAAFHAAGAEINHEDTTNPYYIKRFNFTASTLETAHTIEEMKANIDTLATAGTGWLVWMIHTSSTNGWSSAEVTKLGQAIDYARSLGIEIVTAERGCRTYLPYQGI